jgi:hypothetical protein
MKQNKKQDPPYAESTGGDTDRTTVETPSATPAPLLSLERSGQQPPDVVSPETSGQQPPDEENAQEFCSCLSTW